MFLVTDLEGLFFKLLAVKLLFWAGLLLLTYWPLWVILNFKRPFFSFLNVLALLLYSCVALLLLFGCYYTLKYAISKVYLILKYPVLWFFKTGFCDIAAHTIILSIPAVFFISAYYFSYQSAKQFPRVIIQKIVLVLYSAAAVICSLLFCADIYHFILYRDNSTSSYITWHIPFIFLNFTFLLAVAILHALGVKEKKSVYETSLFNQQR